MNGSFSAAVWQEGPWFVAQCREIDVASQGTSAHEAVSGLREALALHLDRNDEDLEESIRITMEIAPHQPKHVAPDGGEWLHVLGDDVRVLVSGTETGGAFAVVETNTQPGFGPPLHVHTREDETFFRPTSEQVGKNPPDIALLKKLAADSGMTLFV